MKPQKAHLLFEQSGAFKAAFEAAGVPAFDYDIKNDYGRTDYVCDLFEAIDEAYDGRPSILDQITADDLVMAFYPCIYFCGSTNPLFFNGVNRSMHKDHKRRFDQILERADARNVFYKRLYRLFYLAQSRSWKMVFENPWRGCYLRQNFLFEPQIIDYNRRHRGDHFVKPTAYWFVGFEPARQMTYFDNSDKRLVFREPKNTSDGGGALQRRPVRHCRGVRTQLRGRPHPRRGSGSGCNAVVALLNVKKVLKMKNNRPKICIVLKMFISLHKRNNKTK